MNSTNALAPSITGPGLAITISPALLFGNHALQQIPTTTISLAANAFTYIFLDLKNIPMALGTSTTAFPGSASGFPPQVFPIATVTTGPDRVLNLVDSRPDYYFGVFACGG